MKVIGTIRMIIDTQDLQKQRHLFLAGHPTSPDRRIHQHGNLLAQGDQYDELPAKLDDGDTLIVTGLFSRC